ncbi:hypothetical protein DBR47_07310 [Paucibacter sp. KBW04]|nr:hypothetical protein DBR47_07310 [Paucibacter sp. KBW04]
MKFLPRVISRLLQTLAAGAALSFTLAAPAQAQAAWSSLSLSFLQPTGTVGANDSIDVYLRLVNTDATQSFVVDNSLPLGGMNAADLPLEGFAGNDANGQPIYMPFANYSSFYLSVGFGCSGNFTAVGGCLAGPPYTFSFADNPFGQPYSLAAGAHQDYLFGTFKPTAGPVAAGDYFFYRSVLWLNVYGESADGTSLSSVVFPATTCNGDSPAACQGQSYFMRTVTAVPEPASYALFLAGLGLFGLLQRRRRA